MTDEENVHAFYWFVGTVAMGCLLILGIIAWKAIENPVEAGWAIGIAVGVTIVPYLLGRCVLKIEEWL